MELAPAACLLGVIFSATGVGMLLVTGGSLAIANVSCDLVVVETGVCVCAPEMLVTAGMVQGVGAGADGPRFCAAFDTRKALSCGEMVMTGFMEKGLNALGSEELWTFTMPVLPPLVVTRMDWESRIHTVRSSCLWSESLGLETDGLVLQEETGTVLLDKLNGGFHICVPLNPAAFATSSWEPRPPGVLGVLAVFRGATCWTGILFSGMVKPGTLVDIHTGAETLETGTGMPDDCC